ncbi:MAG: tRNA (N(6)-L-threonylcarbamoyladenosine(37)-C(2))-methylthiotran sferase [Promethearchaeota archaeon]
METYGCTYNKADSERVRGVLNAAGHVEVPLDRADVVVVNSCAVKDSTESKILARLAALSATDRLVVLAGCLPRALRGNLGKIYASHPRVVVAGPRALHRLPEVVERGWRGERDVVALEGRDPATVARKISLPVVETHERVAILPIAEGCRHACSYCATKNARDAFFSFPPRALLELALDAVAKGRCIFWVTAQDCGDYSSGGLDLVGLLDALVRLPVEAYFRVGMVNPSYFVSKRADFSRLFRNPKVMQFLHVPVQSASSRVLSDMNRHYDPWQLADAVADMKARHPRLTFSTDVICGFPTESREDFEATVRWLERVRPEVLNVSQFSSRDGTPAKRFRQLPSEVKKARSREVSRRYARWKADLVRRWDGWRGVVLFERPAGAGTWLARNYCQVPVVVPVGESTPPAKTFATLRAWGSRLRAE